MLRWRRSVGAIFLIDMSVVRSSQRLIARVDITMLG
jgi:hypothetical protein